MCESKRIRFGRGGGSTGGAQRSGRGGVEDDERGEASFSTTMALTKDTTDDN